MATEQFKAYEAQSLRARDKANNSVKGMSLQDIIEAAGEPNTSILGIEKVKNTLRFNSGIEAFGVVNCRRDVKTFAPVAESLNLGKVNLIRIKDTNPTHFRCFQFGNTIAIPATAYDVFTYDEFMFLLAHEAGHFLTRKISCVDDEQDDVTEYLSDLIGLLVLDKLGLDLSAAVTAIEKVASLNLDRLFTPFYKHRIENLQAAGTLT